MFYVGHFVSSLYLFSPSYSRVFIFSTLQHPPLQTSPFPILDRRDLSPPIIFKISCSCPLSDLCLSPLVSIRIPAGHTPKQIVCELKYSFSVMDFLSIHFGSVTNFPHLMDTY